MRPAWTLVSIRAAFWAEAILVVLWAPVRGHAVPPFGVGEAHADLGFGALEQWDAQWYLHIAEHGYDSPQSPAFLPMFPLLVGAIGRMIGSYVVAGTLLSLAGAAVGAGLVARIARDVLDDRLAEDSVLYLALYPTAFVFTTAYSDGLFLAFSAGAFLAILRRRSVLAGVLASLAVATRIVGLALLVPMLVLLWPRARSLRELARPLVAALLVVPLVLFAWYLHVHRGDAFAYAHASHYWLRHTPSTGPIGGFWDGLSYGYHGAAELALHLPAHLGAPGGYPMRDQYGAWNALHALVLVASVVLTWYAWRRFGPAYGGYSAATLAIVLVNPPYVFPLQSFPRYLLVDFPLFMALAALTAERSRLRTVILCAFASACALATAAFAHVIWIA